MLGVQLAALLDGAPEGITEAQQVVADFDDALVDGFARVGEQQSAALHALAAAVAGSPLGAPVAAAVADLGTGVVGCERLTTLAAARAAVNGAVHDALLDRLDTALGRTRAGWERPDEGPAELAAVDGCRAWLAEVAIAGWCGVDDDLMASADRAVEALLAVPALRRPAVLLDGLAAELRACEPIVALPRVPARRWADLWSRALLLSWRSAEFEAEPVSGRLLILGADVHEHGTAVQVQVYAVLESAGAAPRRVRASIGAAKVDTIVGPAVWQLLSGHPHLLAALAEHRALDITDMPLTAGGDLWWHDDRASAGAPADPFATAAVQLAQAVAPAVPPLDRDPVHIAEPVFLEGYRVTDGFLRLDDRSLRLELDRLPASGPLTPAAVSTSAACLGLLRWDAGEWSLRPLAVRRKLKGDLVTIHGGDWAMGPTDPKVAKAQAKSGDSITVLRERAGRLLRK
ncbi:hypothetical protein [Nocardia sp. alder85J]|uniref:hypothetical protein n=1 Tax=Nocardia sp. alder85J TaxID=2862949 RepID=UPI001CD6DA04|nr:hypothetical protein [Nocardia sp. alder85J]MCX4090904.1 hypothetical protein [Nocardia sp. alder85J]